MEIIYLLRWAKAFAMGFLMFYSLKTLGVNSQACLFVSLVPFFLGGLNVMTALVYLLTGASFIIASLAVLFPDAKDSIEKFTEETMVEIEEVNTAGETD